MDCYPDRAAAMARAYGSGVHTMAEIGAHFGVHYMTVSHSVKSFEPCKDHDEEGRGGPPDVGL